MFLLIPVMAVMTAVTFVSVAIQEPVKQAKPQTYCEYAQIMGKRVYRCQTSGVVADTGYQVK